MAASLLVRLQIELTPMPAAPCVHPARLSVGLQSGRAGLVRGEALEDRLRFDVEVEARVDEGGTLDFRGPLVHGKRGERFLYVSWGERNGERHEMFRRLKLYLGPLTRAAWSQPGITHEMLSSGRPLVARVSGRQKDGTPACGTAKADWRLGERAGASPND